MLLFYVFAMKLIVSALGSPIQITLELTPLQFHSEKNAKFSTTHLDVAQTIRTYVKWGNTNYDLNSVGPILPIPSEKQYKQQKSIQLTTKFLGYILQITTRETDLELNLWMSRALHNFVE